MSGKPPLEKLKDLGYNLPEEFALLPPIILDDVSTFWAVRGGNNLLTPYILYSLCNVIFISRFNEQNL